MNFYLRQRYRGKTSYIGIFLDRGRSQSMNFSAQSFFVRFNFYLLLFFICFKKKIAQNKTKAHFLRKPILDVIPDIAAKINRKRTINIRRN
jgi:hypothetical protein